MNNGAKAESGAELESLLPFDLKRAVVPLSGSVDKKKQRTAWKVDGSKAPVYEAGISNLTQAQTTMMVHYSKDRSVQMALIRVEDPEKKEE